jgi:predicted nucleic acid-binding protein
VKLYLDSSALVKLVQQETQSAALRQYLRRHRGDDRVTSALARVEVVRAVCSGGAPAIGHARRTLARVGQINLDRSLLDEAATLAPSTLLRTLDAIHLASARLVGSDLRAVVTYDERMAAVASSLGIPVESPGATRHGQGT